MYFKREFDKKHGNCGVLARFVLLLSGMAESFNFVLLLNYLSILKSRNLILSVDFKIPRLDVVVAHHKRFRGELCHRLVRIRIGIKLFRADVAVIIRSR